MTIPLSAPTEDAILISERSIPVASLPEHPIIGDYHLTKVTACEISHYCAGQSFIEPINTLLQGLQDEIDLLISNPLESRLLQSYMGRCVSGERFLIQFCGDMYILQDENKQICGIASLGICNNQVLLNEDISPFEIGYIVLPSHQRKNLGTAMVYSLINELMATDSNAHRVLLIARISQYNESSIRLISRILKSTTSTCISGRRLQFRRSQNNQLETAFLQSMSVIDGSELLYVIQSSKRGDLLRPEQS